MAEHKHLDPEEVRREYLRRGGNVRDTATALEVSRETVYTALRKVPERDIRKVNLPEVGKDDPDGPAILAYLVLCLERSGLRKRKSE